MIKCIEYNGNKQILIRFIEELQDFLIEIDPLKRLRRLPDYGKIYTNNLLKKINRYNGKIYIAEYKNIPIGMIAGIIEQFSKEDETECIPSKPARILELIVSEAYRGKNIGSLLMNEIEKHFQKENCDIVRIEVFEPNKKTHGFYEKHGYQDRAIEMVKKIS